MSTDERRLLEEARAGDVDAFALFVKHFERRVRMVIYRLLDDERDVEETTQDTFVKAWRSLDSFRGDAAPFTWLYRIAVNEALQRRRRKQPAMVEFEEDHSPATESESVTAELQKILIEAIRALPFEHRPCAAPECERGARQSKRFKHLDAAVFVDADAHVRCRSSTAPRSSCAISKGSPTKRWPTRWKSRSPPPRAGSTERA